MNGSEDSYIIAAATSSYITIPPPFTHIYSAGGPTGEVHALDPVSGGFGDKLQQVLFVAEDELDAADKTRVALVCFSSLTKASKTADGSTSVMVLTP